MSVQSFLDGRVVLHAGDCRAVIKTLADNSIDAVVTDPPYALVSIQKRFGKPGSAPAKDGDVYARASAGFMGKQWDTGETAFAAEFWREVLRVLKPGGHVIAFACTRTYHRLACAVEDAGFEIRDMITDLIASDTHVQRFAASLTDEQARAFIQCIEESQFGGMLSWLYGSGFPKSHDVSKAIDKAAGVDFSARPASGVGFMGPDGPGGYNVTKNRLDRSGESTEAARQWQGYGTALKPACEPMVLARKPLIGTVAANVLTHGVGALNIDGCRVAHDEECRPMPAQAQPDGRIIRQAGRRESVLELKPNGRWPANVVHDGSDEVIAGFPDVTTARATVTSVPGGVGGGGKGLPAHTGIYGADESGSASRFFYSAKADADDRIGSKHPTVKPVDLMRWLVRLVTPPNGTVLDPFSGSGTTGEAAWREGFSAILIEREEEYRADIARRMDSAQKSQRERKEIIARERPKQAEPLPLFGDASHAGGGGGRRIYGVFADQSDRSG